MKISLLSALNSNVTSQDEVTWEEIEQLFKVHDNQFTQKTQVPMFSPCEFEEGKPHSGITAIRVHFGVLDVDGATKADIDLIKDKLKDHAYIYYTSWSFSEDDAKYKDQWRVRFLFPFSRAVEKHEWSKFWAKMNAFFEFKIDQNCKNINRGYFYPAAVDLRSHVIEQQPGLELDVDLLLYSNLDTKPVKVPTINDLQALAAKLKRQKSEHKKEMAEILKIGLKGKELAENGNRDNTYFKLAALLAKEYPKVESKDLAKLFDQSLKAATQEGCDKSTIENLAQKIDRAKTKLEEEREVAKKEQQNELASKIALSFGSDANRNYPYTKEELESFAQDANSTLDAFQKRWILQYGKYYFLFHNGKYRPPITRDAMQVAAEIHLAPAISAGVDCYKQTDKGKVLKSEKELMSDYGTPALRYEINLLNDKDYFDDNTHTFIEAPCPMREIEPVFHQEINDWLEVMAGPEKEKLLDWLSQVPNLEVPCAALYIGQNGGIGKSLLANGIARLWTTGGPTEFASVVGQWNDGLLSCPFVFADDYLPDDPKLMGKIRKFIQDKEHKLHRKFHDEVKMKGCVRLFMAANNDTLLETKEHLTSHDVAAIMERIVYIPGQEAAVHHLNSLGGRNYVDQWIEKDMIAQHVVWLNQNRELKEISRFLISGKDSSFHKNLAIGQGLPSAIIHWLIGYLQNPNKLDVNRSHQIMVSEGELIFTSKALSDHWMVYETQTKAPPPARVSRALHRICRQEKAYRRIPGHGRRVNYWVADKENLIAWGELNNYMSREEIEEALSRETQYADHTDTLLDKVSKGQPKFLN